MFERVSFSDTIGIAGLILALVLVALDKSGKLTGRLPLVLLTLAALMTVPLALSIPWVSNGAPSVALWLRRLLALTVVQLCFFVLAVWMTSPGESQPQQLPHEEAGAPTNPLGNPLPPKVEPAASPHLEPKRETSLNTGPLRNQHAPEVKKAPRLITVTGAQAGPVQVGKKIRLQLGLKNNSDSAFEIRALAITGIEPFYDDPVKDRQVEDYIWARVTGYAGEVAPLILPSHNDALAYSTETIPLTQELFDDLQSGARVAYLAVQMRDKDGTVILEFCGHTRTGGGVDYCRAHNGP